MVYYDIVLLFWSAKRYEGYHLNACCIRCNNMQQLYSTLSTYIIHDIAATSPTSPSTVVRAGDIYVDIDCLVVVHNVRCVSYFFLFIGRYTTLSCWLVGLIYACSIAYKIALILILLYYIP